MKNPLISNDELRFNDVVFQNRNKEYGAYVLRNQESGTLIKSLFVGVACFAALAISPLIVNSLQTPAKVTTDTGPYNLKPLDVYEPETPEAEKPAAPEKQVVNTVKVVVPEPTRDSRKETPPPSADEIRDSKIGLETVVGETPPTVYTPVLPATKPAAPEIAAPKTENNNPADIVDVEAAFNGGINSFRTKVADNFNTSNFEGSGDLIKTTVTFIVEKDGSISNVKAAGPNSTFNLEAEKTIRKVKGKWTPAKLRGEFVRSYFKLPIAMQFE